MDTQRYGTGDWPWAKMKYGQRQYRTKNKAETEMRELVVLPRATRDEIKFSEKQVDELALLKVKVRWSTVSGWHRIRQVERRAPGLYAERCRLPHGSFFGVGELQDLVKLEESGR